MNKRFTKLIAALALLVFMTPSLAGWGQTRAEVVTYTLDGTKEGSGNAYAEYHSITQNSVDWKVMGNVTTNPWRIGGKNLSEVDRDLYSEDGFSDNITKVVVTNGTATATVNSMTLIVSTNSDFSNPTSTISGVWNASSTTTFERPAGADWTNMYFKLVYNITAGSSNQYAQFVKAEFYKESNGQQPTTYTVTFDAGDGIFVGNEDFPNESNEVTAGTYSLPNATRENYSLVWSDGTGTYEAGDDYGVTEDVDFTAQWTENTTPSGEWNWVLTNLADLTSSDVFVIVGNNGSDYAMTNNNGTSSAPAASAVTVENDMITSTVATNIQWTISGNATDGYTFYPNGSTTTWLYCTNTNNGVRVGTNAAKTFALDATSGYLKHSGTSRYVGIYNSQDWRCYTSSGGNIADQTFAFYKKVDANTPVISADNLELAYNATTGTINYDITNMVEGGTLSVTNTADWITNVVYTTSASGTITFDVAANPNATSRSTDMLLQYVYGDNQMVNATVTVTQTGNPNITMTIAEVRTQGTGNVYTSGIVTSCVGTTGYIQDETAAICVYGSSLTVGDNITVQGSLTTYNGLLEIANPVVNVISSGNTIEPEVMTIADINASTNQGWYVRIEEAIVQAIGNNNNYTIAQGENTITLHGELDVEVSVNDIISLNGNIGCYNTVQIVNPQNVEVQESTEPSINIDNATIEVAAEGDEGILTVQYENITDIAAEVYFCDAEGTEATYDWITAEIDADNNVEWLVEPNEGEARTAYFKVWAYDDELSEVYSNLVTINQDAYVAPFEPATYTLATSIESGKTYIIVNKESSKAMGAQNENNRAAADVTIQGQTITVTSDAVYEFVIESVSEGKYCIYDDRTGGFLYAASNSSNHLKTEAALDENGNGNWAISIEDGVASIVAQGTNSRKVMQYNSGNTLFSCYASDSQNPVYLYVKEEETPEPEIYELTINGYTDAESKAGYYLIASPVTVNIADVDGLTEGDFDLYSYDESQELEWINYKQEDGSHPFTTLEPGKGYLYAKKATAETPTYTFTLTGTPYDGTPIVLSKQSTGTLAGWNLIGNPSATSNIAPGRAFYIMNSTIGELIASESSTVEPKQGFFVIATEDGEEFEWTAPLDGNLGKVVMNLSRNRGTVVDRAIVRFGEGDQLPKFQLNPNNTKIYFAQADNDYAVVRSAAQGEMPVSFRASENGTYTLAVEAENVEMNYLHLIDNMTGMDVDLLPLCKGGRGDSNNPQTASYTFEAKTSDYASRFRLVFSANGIDEQNAETFAYFNGSEWMVSNLGEATLQVVDVMGRVLSTETISGNAELSLDQPAGVYMLRLINGNDVKVQKVVVR